MSTSERRRASVTRPPGGRIRVGTLTRISTDEVNQPYSLDAQQTGLEQFVASQPGMHITHRFVIRPPARPSSDLACRRRCGWRARGRTTCSSCTGLTG